VIDRGSIFADENMFELLRSEFVAVAIDQAYERRQQDAEGDFWRRIVDQSPRKGTKGTTQGFYIVAPSGELLLFNNNRHPEKVLRLTKQTARKFARSDRSKTKAAAIAAGKVDKRYNPVPPEGGLVVRARGKVLGGYEPTDDRWRKVMQSAVSRDNLWATRAEHDALVKGELPGKLMRRLARFHLVDNTRGEPPMWRDDEVRSLQIERDGDRISGTVSLATKDGERGFDAQIFGFVHVNKGRVTRFDLVADGMFWGEGPYTKGAPKGRFPFAVAFTLADGSDVADAIPPQGSRGWVDGYLR
tara:strand:- start:1336 stop:2238 length:903 start_codon:yes stop_codon:yes gene_type:complete